MMDSRKDTTNPARQPAPSGPDVIYRSDSDDWLAYADGQFVGSDSSNQTAWALARAAHFGPRTPVPTSAEVVVVKEPIVCDDVIDTELFGQVIGIRFHCPGVTERVWVTVPVADTTVLNYPGFTLDLVHEGIEEMAQVLPAIIALVESPEVQQACARWRADRAALGMNIYDQGPLAWLEGNAQ